MTDRLTPEFKLLVASAPYPLRLAEGERLTRLCQEVKDWKRLAVLVKRHKLRPSVYLNLNRFAAEEVPPKLLHHLQAKYEEGKHQSLVLLDEFWQVCRACRSRAVPVWLLKGPILAQTIFGDPSLRTSRDLDILVPLNRVATAQQVLEALGYRLTLPARPLQPRQWRAFQLLNHHSAYFHPEKQIEIELHWSLASAYLLDPAVMYQMQARAVASTGPEESVPVLNLEDNLVCLLIHGAKHNWATLKLIVDIDALVRNQVPVNWEQIVKTLTDLQLKRPLVQGLGLAQRVLATPLPAGVARAMEAEPQTQALVEGSFQALLAEKDYLKVPGPFTEFKQALYLANLRPGWRYRHSYLTAFLLHSLKDWTDYPLPDALFPLYYMIRPFTWLWRYFKPGAAHAV